jgi:hypothetical protein
MRFVLGAPTAARGSWQGSAWRSCLVSGFALPYLMWGDIEVLPRKTTTKTGARRSQSPNYVFRAVAALGACPPWRERRDVETARWAVSKGETFQRNVSSPVIHPATVGGQVDRRYNWSFETARRAPLPNSGRIDCYWGFQRRTGLRAALTSSRRVRRVVWGA